MIKMKSRFRLPTQPITREQALEKCKKVWVHMWYWNIDEAWLVDFINSYKVEGVQFTVEELRCKNARYKLENGNQ